MAADTSVTIDTYKCVLNVNNQDISPYVKKVKYPSTWKAIPVTTFSKVGDTYHSGIWDTKFTATLLFNQVATTGIHTVVGAVHYAKTSVAFIFYPATIVAGNLKISGNCIIPHYEIIGEVGDIVLVEAEFWTDNGCTFGVAT